MKRSSSLFIAFLALLVASPLALRADSISFAFSMPSTEQLKANIQAIGTTNPLANASHPLLVSAVTGSVMTVSDTAHSSTFSLPGSISIAVIPIGAGSYTPQHTGSTYTGLTASYLGASTATTITVTSSLCGGICLSGDYDEGTYVSTIMGGKTGTFTGTFIPTYVAPYVLSLFGDVAPASYTTADDDYYTDSNKFAGSLPNHEVDEGIDINGSLSGIAVDASPIPEPSSLVFLGTGLLTLAGGLGLRLRRKDSADPMATVAL